MSGAEKRVYFYSGNSLLGIYHAIETPEGEFLRIDTVKRMLYVGGRLLPPQDRLGWAADARLTPYGNELGTSTAKDRVKFATYFDGNEGMYADQRWYTGGRFLTPDPYVASGGVASPSSWNRYAYVQGDPVNFRDPRGLFACPVGTGEHKELVECHLTVLVFSETQTGSPGRVALLNGQFEGDRNALLDALTNLQTRTTFSQNCRDGSSSLMTGLTPEDIVKASHEVSIKNGVLDYKPIGQAYGDPRVGAAAQSEYNNRGYAVSDDVTNNVTVADFFNGDRGVQAWTPYRGNTIYIHPGRLSTGDAVRDQSFLMHELLHNTWVFRLSWKWRKRSAVKITERTREKGTKALHC
jgi:RHS repeat-associated protein